MTEHDPEYPRGDEDEFHPLGSCDECEANLYETDVYSIPGYGEVCGQCAWRIRMRGAVE